MNTEVFSRSDNLASATILTAETLADRITTGFSKIKLKKASVKVPRLKVRKNKAAKLKSDDKIPISSIISILIKAAVEKAKREKKEKAVDEDKSYKLIKEEKAANISGYGTSSKGYGTSPHASYVDYGKLFSYLGKFRSQSAYENMGNPLEALNKATESGSFTLVDKESMDKIGRYDKYVKSPVMAIQTIALSLVPVAGLSSGEWEEIKNLLRFDPVIYTLKSKTS